MNTKGFSFGWAILGLVAGLTALLAWSMWTWSSLVVSELSTRRALNLEDDQTIARYRASLANDEESALRVTKFLAAWEPYTNPFADKKDRQAAILRVLEDEAIALQDLLVGAKVTPTGKSYRFGDQALDVEQVQMKVSGPVSKALVFLGRVEEQFPYARIARWSLEPTEAGRGVSLDFRLVQPVKAKTP